MRKQDVSGDARSVRTARELIRRATRGQEREFTETAVLLTDELVTNAVLHGGGRFALTVQMLPKALHVSVMDSSPYPPLVYDKSVSREHGRGMAIVDLLSSSWGTRTDREGKQVWFELSR